MQAEARRKSALKKELYDTNAWEKLSVGERDGGAEGGEEREKRAEKNETCFILN